LGWQTAHLTTPKQGSGTQLQEEVDGWIFHRTPNAGGNGLLSQMRLTAARLREVVLMTKPDLIHAHSPVLNALPSLWVGRRQRLPVVYEMRASWEDAAVDHGTTQEGSLRYRTSRSLESLALRHADQVTTICEGLRGDIASRGIPPERITVIPNAVDVSLFHLDTEPDAELRRSLGLDGATVVGFAGSFYGYEGLDLLIEAVRQMLPRHPQLRRAAGRRRTAGEQSAGAGCGWFAGVRDFYRSGTARRSATLLRTDRRPRLPASADPADRTGDAAQAARSHGAGTDACRLRCRRAPRVDSPRRNRLPVPRRRRRCSRWGNRRCSRPTPVLAKAPPQARRFVEVERTWASSVARYREVYRRALARHDRSPTI
jgi:glycogen(starch) synthase